MHANAMIYEVILVSTANVVSPPSRADYDNHLVRPIGGDPHPREGAVSHRLLHHRGGDLPEEESLRECLLHRLSG